MGDDYNPLSKLFDNTPIICDKCGGPCEYSGAGEYKCKNCGEIAYDDYGKVRKFIDEHGPAPYHVVKKATGVDGKLVREYLDSPNSTKTFDRKCLRCGCRISGGRLCSACQMVESRVKASENDKPHKRRSLRDSKGSSDLGAGFHFVRDKE